jgi:SAM-dependent methyltransferase
LGIHSVLDVGSGTGRGLRHLMRVHPGLELKGIEPVAALSQGAIGQHGVPADMVIEARGEALPFPDRSFDAVCELGMLHHVPNPSAVVGEMLRVARRAIFISDCNRFGQGPMAERLAKLALYKFGLWNAVNRMKTRGRGYTITEGDGLAYSYSIYDSYGQVAAWADRIILIPTSRETSRTWLNPLLTASHVLLCGLRSA